MAIDFEYEKQGNYPINPTLIGAGMMRQGIMGAVDVYSTMQNLRRQNEELEIQKKAMDDAKRDKQANLALTLFSDKKTPVAVRVKAFNNGVVPYWNSFGGDQPVPTISEADFDNPDFQKLVEQVNLVTTSNKPADQKKMELNILGSQYLAKIGEEKAAIAQLLSGSETEGPLYIFDQSSGQFYDSQKRPVSPGSVPKNARIERFSSASDSVRTENLDARRKKALDENTQKLSKRLDDIGIPEAMIQLNKINELLPKTGGIPGYGRVESLVPDVMAGDAGRALRQAVQSLQNVKIKDRSGAAVTPPEFVRLAQEFGSGKLKTEAQLRQGLEQALGAYRERARNVMAGFDGDTKDAYLSRENINNPIDVLSGFVFDPSTKKDNSSVTSTPSKISSDEEYNSLPSGSQFIGPDGKLRRKP